LKGKNNIGIKAHPESIELMEELKKIEEERGREKNTMPELTLLVARKIKSLGGWKKEF